MSESNQRFVSQYRHSLQLLALTAFVCLVPACSKPDCPSVATAVHEAYAPCLRTIAADGP